MFYLEKDIAQELICPNCQCKFVDPRILPCSHSLCRGCILLVTSADNSSVVCQVCSRKHLLTPGQEFIRNEFINKLLDIKSYEVKRGRNSELLKQQVKSLDELKNQMTKLSSTEECELELFNHLSGLRAEIDEITELKIQMLNNEREKLIQELNEYSTTCLQNIRKKCETEKQDLDSIELFVSEVSDYLSRPDLDETYIDVKIREAKTLYFHSNESRNEMEKKIFMNKKPRFIAYNRTHENDRIGRIAFENMSDTKRIKPKQSILAMD